MPTAVATLRACSIFGIDVHSAFLRFQPACAAHLGPGPDYAVDNWLRELSGDLKASELAARSGLSRMSAARWLDGTTKPRLSGFLAVVEAITGRASDLIDALVTVELVPELQALHRQRVVAKTLAFDEPWSAAVMRVAETEDYRSLSRHERGYFAARLGFDPGLEQPLLDLLASAGALKKTGERYEAGTPLTVDTDATPEAGRGIRTHWNQVCNRRTQSPRPADWLGFNVISTSADDLERIREVLRHAFREIRSIAAASEPVESVALLNVQLVTFNET